MNQAHLEFLASPDWAEMLRNDLLPWIEEAADLGDDVLEIGPGPGLTTDLLRERTAKVTAIELDDDLAAALAERLAGTNVEVVHADATQSGLPERRFSAATCFSMLHHMPSPESQDSLFAEVCRLLQPGSIFIGIDSVDHEIIREFHVDDIFTPVDPETLPMRLEAAGFTDAHADVAPDGFQVRFQATKP